MKLFNRRPTYRSFDGYLRKMQKDGYIQNPFSHGEYSTSDDKESQYYMQWTDSQKLHRISLRTAIGNRMTYGYSKDLWNNEFGIRLKDEKKSENTNSKLIPYLRSRQWFREMQKLTAYKKEQGESILLLYFKDGDTYQNFKNPVSFNDEIIAVEAINYMDYYISDFKGGEPSNYRIAVQSKIISRGIEYIDVHPSRVIRYRGENVEYRHSGYSDIAPVADPIMILSEIIKAAGLASFRWATGHPTIFTKGLVTEAEFQEFENILGDYTNRSVHVFPTEFVEKVEMLGQAGAMLNIKSLADIMIDQIIIATGFPRSILLGEATGVSQGEVNNKSYFSLLDADHTELEPVVLEYFRRDKNIRALLKREGGVILDPKNKSLDTLFDIEWGIRQVFDKMDQAHYDQLTISNNLALTQVLTIDEIRQRMGYDKIGPDNYGDVVLGLEAFYLFELQTITQAAMLQQTAGQEINENTRKISTNTEKQQVSTREDVKNQKRMQAKAGTAVKTDAEKERFEKLKDAFRDMRKELSPRKLSEKLNIAPKTMLKILKELEGDGSSG